MSGIIDLRTRYSFILKLLGAAFVATIVDVSIIEPVWHNPMGMIALTWTVAMALAVPQVRKSRPAMAALACAAALTLVLFDDPGLLAWTLFWIALSSAALLPRVRFHDALQFALRLFLQGAMGLGKAVRDLAHVLRLPRPDFRNTAVTLIAALALPLLGAGVFIALFASANPIVERLLPDLAFPSFSENDVLRCLLWAAAFILVWPSLRPSRAAMRLEFTPSERALNLPGVSVISITISLLLFNAIFAVQNALDVAFLWSGAPLPKGVTLAQYAHRGAYPLIVTALLAAAFVLMTAQPDTEIGRRPLVRRLVVIWIVQNLILVASSVIRTVDYIDAYMMTRLRLAALIWMALVATGLVLICWRMIARLPLRWLINAIALSAALVLGGVSVIDLGTVAAEWNVRHAREVGGSGQPLDLGYLHSLGMSAVVPLARLEQQPLNGAFLDRVAYVRGEIVTSADFEQQKAYGWTWREIRRLAAMNEILGPSPRVPARVYGRGYDGQPYPAPRPFRREQAAPLTSAPAQ